MRVATSLIVLAVVAASALAAGRFGRVSELRAVDASADVIRRADGALLAAFEGDGRARLRWLRPLTLRPASPPLRLRDEFVSDFALSPDGRTLALGSGTHSRIEFVDLLRWRSLGSMRVSGARPAGYRGVFGLVWARPRRLLALAGPPRMRAWPVVVDPLKRRVLHRSPLRGTPIRWQAAGDRLVFLSVSESQSRPSDPRLLSYDAQGRLRRVRLGRIAAGNWRSRRGPWRRVEPGLAATAQRAYVVAADGRLVADVDVRGWRLDYRDVSEARSAWRRLTELVESPAYAKGPLESSIRDAQVLPGGAIAVTGENMAITDDPRDVKTTAYGVRLIDPASWSWRAADRDAQDVTARRRHPARETLVLPTVHQCAPVDRVARLRHRRRPAVRALPRRRGDRPRRRRRPRVCRREAQAHPQRPRGRARDRQDRASLAVPRAAAPGPAGVGTRQLAHCG